MDGFFKAIAVPDLLVSKYAGFEAGCRLGRPLPGGGKRQPLCRQTKSRQAAYPRDLHTLPRNQEAICFGRWQGANAADRPDGRQGIGKVASGPDEIGPKALSYSGQIGRAHV